jgi:hypothetical protein
LQMIILHISYSVEIPSVFSFDTWKSSLGESKIGPAWHTRWLGKCGKTRPFLGNWDHTCFKCLDLSCNTCFLSPWGFCLVLHILIRIIRWC